MNQYTINSPARIHLGFLDLSFKNVRNFGSLGMAISNFGTIIQAKSSKKLKLVGEKSKKLEVMLKRFYDFYKFQPCEIKITRKIPEHVGLGSGTQLSLSLGLLLSKISGKEISVEELARFCQRGLRSSIGINCFKNGGFFVDAGRVSHSKNLSPVIFHQKWPEEWQIILIMESTATGIHGNKEKKEFKKISKNNISLQSNNCEALVMMIIPSIIERNFELFCKGISKIQKNTGEYFNSAQGGLYSSKKIGNIFKKLEKAGYDGFGQTSWGPTGFVFCKNDNEKKKIFSILKREININSYDSLSLHQVTGRNRGYYISKSNKKI